MLIVRHDNNMINRLKKYLGSKFAMKDLDPTQHILGMRIMCDKKNKRLWFSQEKYIKKVIKRFNLKGAKPIDTPLATHFKSSIELCPSDDKEKEDMRNIPYASVVGSLMYAMVCTKPNTAYSMGDVSKFLSNPRKQH